jgi:dTDP-4-amino-4,6-dideoxygalactose transaminase
VHYYPVHRQPFWRQAAPGLALPGADACYERLLSLPLFPGMSDTDPDRVMDALEAAMGGA